MHNDLAVPEGNDLEVSSLQVWSPFKGEKLCEATVLQGLALHQPHVTSSTRPVFRVGENTLALLLFVKEGDYAFRLRRGLFVLGGVREPGLLSFTSSSSSPLLHFIILLSSSPPPRSWLILTSAVSFLFVRRLSPASRVCFIVSRAKPETERLLQTFHWSGVDLSAVSSLESMTREGIPPRLPDGRLSPI